MFRLTLSALFWNHYLKRKGARLTMCFPFVLHWTFALRAQVVARPLEWRMAASPTLPWSRPPCTTHGTLHGEAAWTCRSWKARTERGALATTTPSSGCRSTWDTSVEWLPWQHKVAMATGNGSGSTNCRTALVATSSSFTASKDASRFVSDFIAQFYSLDIVRLWKRRVQYNRHFCCCWNSYPETLILCSIVRSSSCNWILFFFSVFFFSCMCFVSLSFICFGFFLQHIRNAYFYPVVVGRKYRPEFHRGQSSFPEFPSALRPLPPEELAITYFHASWSLRL